MKRWPLNVVRITGWVGQYVTIASASTLRNIIFLQSPSQLVHQYVLHGSPADRFALYMTFASLVEASFEEAVA